jgi:hypothetical protein
MRELSTDERDRIRCLATVMLRLLDYTDLAERALDAGARSRRVA